MLVPPSLAEAKTDGTTLSFEYYKAPFLEPRRFLFVCLVGLGGGAGDSGGGVGHISNLQKRNYKIFHIT